MFLCLTLKRIGNAGVAGHQRLQVPVQVRAQYRHVRLLLVDVGRDGHGALAVDTGNRCRALARCQRCHVGERHLAAVRRADQVFIQGCRGSSLLPRQTHYYAYIIAPALNALRFKAAKRLADLVRNGRAGQAQYVTLRGQFNLQLFLAVGEAVGDIEDRRIGHQPLFYLFAYFCQGLQGAGAELNIDRVPGADEFGAISQRFSAGYPADLPAPFLEQVICSNIGETFVGRHRLNDYLPIIITAGQSVSRSSR